MMINHFEFRNLWPTPLLKTRVELPHEEISDYVREKFVGFDEYTSYYNEDFNAHIKQMLPHRELMERCMIRGGDLFLKERNYGVPEEKLSYWFSVYNEADDHCLHTHPNTLIAGTYYPYADDMSAPIRFRSPTSGHPDALRTEDRTRRPVPQPRTSHRRYALLAIMVRARSSSTETGGRL